MTGRRSVTQRPEPFAASTFTCPNCVIRPSLVTFSTRCLLMSDQALFIFPRCKLAAISILVDSLDDTINPAKAESLLHGFFIAERRPARVLVEDQPHSVLFLIVICGQPLPPLASGRDADLFHAERATERCGRPGASALMTDINRPHSLQ